MQKEKLEFFKNLLLEKRDEVLEELRQYKNQDSESSNYNSSDQETNTAYHMADVGTDTEELEKKYYLASFEGMQLREIDEALSRIREGTYGLCISCGSEINCERLEVIPEAKKCISCKANEETTRF